MFILCRPEDSNSFHEELIDIEENLYTSLGLHFKCVFNLFSFLTSMMFASLLFSRICLYSVALRCIAYISELLIWHQRTWVHQRIVNLMLKHGCLDWNAMARCVSHNFPPKNFFHDCLCILKFILKLDGYNVLYSTDIECI